MLQPEIEPVQSVEAAPLSTWQRVRGAVREHYPDALRGAARGLGCLAAATAFMAGPSVEHGLETAQIHTAIAQFPATISFTGDATSRAALGPLGTVYATENKHGIGLAARIDNLPAGDVTQVFSKSAIASYSAFFTHGNLEESVKGYTTLLEQDATRRALDYGTLPAGAGALLLFGGIEVLRRRPSESADKRRGVATATALSLLAGAMSYQLVAAPLHQWQAEYPPAASKYYPFAPRADIYVDSGPLNLAIQQGVPYYKKIAAKNKADRADFTATMESSLDREKAYLQPARTGERMIWLESDEHSNDLATMFRGKVYEYLENTYGAGTVDVVLSVGDRTFGTPAESGAERAERDIFKITPVVTVDGNHDQVGAKQATANGYIEADGKVVSAGGVKILGMHDPTHTEYLGGDSHEAGVSETSVGADGRKIAEDKHPDVFAVHEGYAMASFLGVDEDMHQFMAAASSSVPYDDNVPDVPARLFAYGHWHRDVEPRVVRNDDGSWSLGVELGTAGGAIEAPTPGNFSLPNQPPRKTAKFTLVYQNETSGLVTGYSEVRISPEGEVSVGRRVEVGTANGQPYVVKTIEVAGRTVHEYSEAGGRVAGTRK